MSNKLTGEENCIYCGLVATEIDHAVPRSYLKYNPLAHTVLVPSCPECNNTLNDRLFESLDERRKYILAAYMKKYYKILESPDWSYEEIDELGYTMQAFIMGQVIEKRILLARLSILELPIDNSKLIIIANPL